MSFKLERPTEGVALIAVGKTIGVRNAERLQDTCDEAIEQGARQFVFDLTETKSIDTQGLRVLIALHQRLTKLNVESPAVVLSSAQSGVRSIFEVTKTERLFTFAGDLEEAESLL